MFRHRLLCLLALGLPLADAAAGRAANWATGVVAYAAGKTYPAPDPGDWTPAPPDAVNATYTTASTAALAGLTADTGIGTPYPSVLTPFNGAWQPGALLGIGQGGSITLQFTHPVRTDGYTIGVHTGTTLAETDYPNGNAGSVATILSTPRRAAVAVSDDGELWFPLGTFDLNNPSNYYATGVDAPSYQLSVTAGTLADVEKPFLGSVSSFDGQSWPQILATLDGSAGGTWLDLSATGLPSISYIQFTVPTGSALYLDGVVGLPAPEPSSLAVLALGAWGLILGRRKRAADEHK